MFKNKLLRRLMNLMMGVQFMAVDGDGGGSDNPNTDNPNTDNPNTDNPNTDTDNPKPNTNNPKPTDAEARLLRELMDKKGALKRTNGELAEAKQQLAKFDKYNLEEIDALLKEREDAEVSKLEQKGEWERLKEKLLEQQSAEKATSDAKIAELEQRLANKELSINNLAMGSAFDTSDFIANELTLTPNKAKIIYGSHFDFEGDKIVGYDKPKGSSERTMLIDASGEPLSFDAAMTKIIEGDVDKDHLIRAKFKPGADSGTDNGDIPPNKPKVKGRSRISAALNAVS